MSLGMDVHAELPFFRQQAESLMSDTIIIERSSGDVWDEESGQYLPGVEPVYEGMGRVRDTNARGRRVDDAAADTTVLNLMLSLPVAAGAVAEIGDVATMTASPTNPSLVGNRYRLMEPADSTFASARRFIIERYVAGG